MQVGGKAAEPGAVHQHLAPFQAVPVPVGCGLRNAVVDPSWGYVVGEFIVEDCLEGRYNLWSFRRDQPGILSKIIMKTASPEKQVRASSAWRRTKASFDLSGSQQSISYVQYTIKKKDL